MSHPPTIRCPGCGWPLARVLPDRRVLLSPVAEPVTLEDGSPAAQCWNCARRVPICAQGRNGESVVLD